MADAFYNVLKGGRARATAIVGLFVFSSPAFALPSVIEFRGTQLFAKQLAPHVTAFVGKDGTAGSPFIEVGIVTVREGEPHWTASRETLVQVLKKKPLLAPLIVRGETERAALLLDYGQKSARGGGVEFVLMRHFLNRAGDLITIDARIRFESESDQAWQRTIRDRNLIAAEFIRLLTELERSDANGGLEPRRN